MAPQWLTAIAWAYLSLCFWFAGMIAYDIVVNHRRQPMGVMNFVFPITALYLGPFALALYWRWGRVSPPDDDVTDAHDPGSGVPNGDVAGRSGVGQRWRPNTRRRARSSRHGQCHRPRER